MTLTRGHKKSLHLYDAGLKFKTTNFSLQVVVESPYLLREQRHLKPLHQQQQLLHR